MGNPCHTAIIRPSVRTYRFPIWHSYLRTLSGGRFSAICWLLLMGTEDVAEDLHSGRAAPCRCRSEDSALGGRLWVTIPGGFPKPFQSHVLCTICRVSLKILVEPGVEVNQEPPSPQRTHLPECIPLTTFSDKGRALRITVQLHSNRNAMSATVVPLSKYSRSKLCTGVQMDPTPANSDFLHYLGLPRRLCSLHPFRS